jgi:hypothetical protein
MPLNAEILLSYKSKRSLKDDGKRLGNQKVRHDNDTAEA